jgi:hypothetical protein
MSEVNAGDVARKKRRATNARRWRNAHPEKDAEIRRRSQANRRGNGDDRAYHLRRTHGLDVADWAALWEAQNGQCYLCGNELDPAPQKTHVEHYHGCVAHAPKKSCKYCQRGLACSRCNTMIALAWDDSAFLRKIADVLEAANRDVLTRQEKAPQQLTLEVG